LPALKHCVYDRVFGRAPKENQKHQGTAIADLSLALLANQQLRKNGTCENRAKSLYYFIKYKLSQFSIMYCYDFTN